MKSEKVKTEKVHCTKNEVFQETADLVTFTEKILNGKHFLRSGISQKEESNNVK